MSRVSAWCEIFGSDAVESAASPELQAMTRAGVSLRPRNGAPAGPGLLLFDAPSDTLYEHVRAVSRHGVERVLAIARTPGALAHGVGWRLLEAGASDVLTWRGAADVAAETALRLERWRTVDELLAAPVVKDNLVGQSPAWLAVLRQIVEVGHFTDASILVTGESGTGKELVARLVHTLDCRPRKRELIVLDCATVVPELSGSEFFGHERGAFTGAVGARDGAFALADGGTLFLDEVGELPLPLQGQLLRVVQERTYKRVGGNAWHRTEFRLVCATNRDLGTEVERRTFRGDLYHRIANWSCQLPPLRERREDIVPLTDHFIRELRGGDDGPQLGDEVRDYLLARDYPGNVRELRQCIARIMHRHVGAGPITVGDVPPEERPTGPGERDAWPDATFERCVRAALARGLGLKGVGRLAEDIAVRIAIAEEAGSLQRAARALGVTDRALQLRRASRRPGGGAASPHHS
jgi:transcriptional regulator with GAF, ATPase, and Fis domain